MCGNDVSGPSPATALSVTKPPVPIVVGDPAGGCTRNRFAGKSSDRQPGVLQRHVDDNGSGSTVVKANTVFGTLGCIGNNPPPTNAGQANTAGTKTGQCAGL